MTHAQRLSLCAAGMLACAVSAQPAMAGGKPAAPASHPAVSAPHPAMPAAHAAVAAPRAPMAPQRAPMAASGHQVGANRYAAPAHAGGPGATAFQGGHAAVPQARAAVAPTHYASAAMHAGITPDYAGGRSRAEPMGDATRGAERGGADVPGGRHTELAENDPARAHGQYDEHQRNPERERDIERLHGHDFHARDVRYFNHDEWGRWRGGYWQRDYYDGRFGWWFDVGGVYYPYAAPIWPYPLEVAPLAAMDAAAAPPPDPGITPLPALPRVAYHCASPNGFYPSVDSCVAGWIILAAH